MKILILGFMMLELTSGAAIAASKTESIQTPQLKSTKAKPTVVKQSTKSSLSTDVKFGDQSVGGKYQLPMEALSVVENEKSIDDLIGVRKNFRDRVARSKGMR